MSSLCEAMQLEFLKYQNIICLYTILSKFWKKTW